jgi:hypothetical protein
MHIVTIFGLSKVISWDSTTKVVAKQVGGLEKARSAKLQVSDTPAQAMHI